MRFRSITVIAFLASVMAAFSYDPVFGQTRLGLQVTQEELTIWRQRAVAGPYKSVGDVSADSPGDWTRISNNAENFRGNPTQGLWAGPTGSGCQSTADVNPPNEPETRRVRDAAFKALINQDTDLKNKVRDWLLTQSAYSNLDYSNRTRWCIASSASEWLFQMAQWMREVLMAMDFIEVLDPNVFTTPQRTPLESWFYNFAEISDGSIRASLNSVFHDRENDDYTPTIGNFPLSYPSWLEADGTPAPNCAFYCRLWNNRKGSVAAATAMIAVKFPSAAGFKAHMARFAKEIIIFGMFPQPTGLLVDFQRWQNSPTSLNPDRGWQYAQAALALGLVIADVFARAGDPSIYEYTTSLGLYGSEGGVKNYLAAIISMANYEDGTFSRYGTAIGANAGNVDYRIDGRYTTANCSTCGGKYALNGLYWVFANVYFKNAYLRGIYMHTGPGTAAYPSTGNSVNSTLDYQGVGGMFPGVLFMFGQMEGKVWPYPTGGSQLTTINFLADPITVASGQSSTLTWSTSNATSCSASGGWTGTKATLGTQSVTPTHTTTYTLSCTGSGGSATQSTTVNIFTPSQTGTIAINAGGSSYTAADGTVHEADIFYSGGSPYKTAEVIGNTSAGALYQTERYGNFSYTIPVSDGDYTLTLYFAEIYWNAPTKRIFDVIVEGTERISDLDIYAVAGKNKAYDITLPVEVNDGVLNLEFRTDIDNAKLSGLKLTKTSLSPPAPPTGLNVVVRE